MPVFIDDLLSRVEKPARYTGGEMNATTKSFDDADVTFAFCFPDTYEVAMSHLGMKILYGILNDLPYAPVRAGLYAVDGYAAGAESGGAAAVFAGKPPCPE